MWSASSYLKNYINLKQFNLLLIEDDNLKVDFYFQVPLFVPIIVIAFSIFLVITAFMGNPTLEYFYILLLHLVGVLVYTLFVYYKFSIPGIGNSLKFIVLLT